MPGFSCGRYPRLIAHRGWKTILPENSEAAFAAAIGVGATEIECDVCTSADGVPVVMHDRTLDRTTTGERAINELPADLILSAALKDGAGRVYPSMRVPTLAEVLELCQGRVGLNLHVKSGPGLPETVAMFRDHMETNGYSADWYLAGDRDAMETALAIAPKVERCYLGSQSDPKRQITESVELSCGRIQLARKATQAHIRQCRERGLIVNYFYSDDPDEAARLIDAGADALLTDDIGLVLLALAPKLLRTSRTLRRSRSGG